MNDDIVTRLRDDTRSAHHASLSDEAADHIETLRAQVARLRQTQRRLFDGPPIRMLCRIGLHTKRAMFPSDDFYTCPHCYVSFGKRDPTI